MIQEYNDIETIKKHRRICDVCHVEIKRGMTCSVARCEVCKIDLCDKCVEHEANTMGDYRETYCKKCWNIGIFYLDSIKAHENYIEKLYKDWYAECNLKN